jgi:hypothetical protein
MSFDTDPREEHDAEMYAAFAAKDKRIKELESQLHDAKQEELRIHGEKCDWMNRALTAEAQNVAQAGQGPKAYHVLWEGAGYGLNESLYYGDNAKEHMQGAVDYAATIPRQASVTPLYSTPPAQTGQEPAFWWSDPPKFPLKHDEPSAYISSVEISCSVPFYSTPPAPANAITNGPAMDALHTEIKAVRENNIVSAALEAAAQIVDQMAWDAEHDVEPTSLIYWLKKKAAEIRAIDQQVILNSMQEKS